MALPILKADGIRDEIACPFCGSDDYSPATGLVPDLTGANVSPPYDDMRFQMVRCSGCRLNYQRIQPAQADIGMFYDSEYFCYVPMSERGFIVNVLAKMSAKSLVKKLRAHAPSNHCTLFDYGCGNGNWMSLLQSVGAPWKMSGSEIDEDIVKLVRDAGFDAVVATDHNLEEKVPPESVGIFFMNHVIEHVRNPLSLFEKIYRLLEPGGIVYGQTPNSDCLEARLFGDRWTQWHLPQHLVVFDMDTMRAHAEKAGLEVVELSSSPSGATQWAASLLWAWSTRWGREYRATREPWQAPLTLLFAPFSVIQSKLSSTSHMDFMLRKPRGT
ncbi:MAG: class I SAM-dependent methyltransferase [Halieaceae bacterium]|nr:class I SAM-dependent methyltransferase [Halieaceae bacterium]